ncbi:MAG: hypothetical protein IT454_09960 [Planctomycetes bacterium]|nr:hypothetical protein [Planctomycetota bacterium]
MNSNARIALALSALGLSAAVLACASGSTEPVPESAPAIDVAPAQSGPAFMAGQRCALCHSSSPRANAMKDRNGNDVSPHFTWSATTMANSFRDPYWRAQMAHEIEVEPQAKAAIEGLCLRCHAPMASHQARLDGLAPPTIEAASADPLAQDGVSCTVCHQANPSSFGRPESFSGRLDIRNDKRIYGPFENPAPGPMRMHTGYTPTHGEHISESGLCGSCHTLYTQAAGADQPFLEQAPYLEWRNSVFSDEGGASEQSRSCTQCHMPNNGPMRIARMPPGGDFNIRVRDNVRSHTFVGGNAFLLDLLAANAAELGVTASPDALRAAAQATRAQLAHETARIEVQHVERTATQLRFDVQVENLAGHKLPSGYPSRRAWLHVEVRAGSTLVFTSGATDDDGRLLGVADEFAEPHHDTIERTDQVQIYEMIALNAAGQPTTSLAEMVVHRKDTRLLPRGWRENGPHADETRPVGIEGDGDFADGRDTVHYSLALPASAAGNLTVIARLEYQTIPPGWADGLRDSKTPEAQTFLRMYDEAPKTAETLAITATIVPATN